MKIAYVAAMSMKTYSYVIGLPGMLIVKLRNKFHKYHIPRFISDDKIWRNYKIL